MPQRPLRAIGAIVASLLPYPFLKIQDHLNKGCGDGLCGTFSGLLILCGLFVATLILIVQSAKRDEAPVVLRLVPLAIWAFVTLPLLFL